MSGFRGSESEWRQIRWFCPNCRSLIEGSLNKEGVAKAACAVCGTFMIRRRVSAKKDVIEVYAPEGEVSLVTGNHGNGRKKKQN